MIYIQLVIIILIYLQISYIDTLFKLKYVKTGVNGLVVRGKPAKREKNKGSGIASGATLIFLGTSMHRARFVHC